MKDLTIVKKGNFHVLDIPENFVLKINQKFDIIVNDEISLTSNGDVHIDTIDSKLFLNCRNSSILRDTKEAIDYKAKRDEEISIQSQEYHDERKQLYDRIDRLEKLVEKLLEK